MRSDAPPAAPPDGVRLRDFYTWPGLLCALLYAILHTGTVLAAVLWRGWDFVGANGIPWSVFARDTATLCAMYAVLVFLLVPAVGWLLKRARHAMFLGTMVVTIALWIIAYVLGDVLRTTIASPFPPALDLAVRLAAALPAALLWQAIGDPRTSAANPTAFD